MNKKAKQNSKSTSPEVLPGSPEYGMKVLDAYAAGRTAEKDAEITTLRASLLFANELLAVHNMAVCDQHAVSWKLDAFTKCPECGGVEK